MHDYSLDDLIIDSPVYHQKKKKGPIVIVALIVILLLLVIFISKTILDPSENDEANNEINKSELVKADLIPTIDENKSSNDRLDSIIEEKLLDRAIVPKSITKETKEKEPEIIKDLKPAIELNSKDTSKALSKDINKSVKVQKLKKKVVVTKKPKVEKKVVKKPSELFKQTSTEYFVQIGAFNKDPNPKYLNRIKKAGFKYVIHKNDKTQRVRVGPYLSKDKAREALSDINDTMGIKGFIIRRNP